MLARIQRGSNTYAVYELNHDGASIDEVSVCMINNNQNSAIGLAPIQFEAVNGTYTNMQFDVTGKVTLREYIGRNITQEAFRRMMLNLIDTIEGFEEYMIDVRQVLLDIDCTFINELDHSVSFICVAVKETEQSGDLFEFFKSIVENCRVAASVNEVSYFHCVWNVIRSGSGFSLSNMRIAMANAKPDGTIAVPQQKAQNAPHAVPHAPIMPKRPEEPETITVSSQTQQSPQPMVPPVQMNENEMDKKKGLFGGIFAQKKKKPEPAPSGYQGGLAGLKNGPQKPGQVPPAVPQQMNGVPAPQNMNAPVNQFQNAPQTMQQGPVGYGGTTVLNGGMAKIPQPGVQPARGPHPAAPIQNPAAPVPNPAGSVPMGTTVLNQPIHPAGSPVAPQPSGMFNPSMAKPGAAPAMPAQNPGGYAGASGMKQPVQSAPVPPSAAPSPLGTTVLNQPMPAPPSQSAANHTPMFNQPAASTAPKPSLVKQPMPAPSAQQIPGGMTGAPMVNGNTNPAGAVAFETRAFQNEYGVGTTVLMTPAMAAAVLIRTKNGDRIALNKDVIRIGRDRNDLDYCVNDNTAVGHNHANILKRGEAYYIVDQNSKNHTYVNGVMLQPSVETKLINGDIVRLGNENFEFRIS